MATLYALKKYEEIEDFFWRRQLVIGGEGKCRKHLGKDIIWSVEKRKFRKEKYLEKENIWSAEVVEKEENI